MFENMRIENLTTPFKPFRVITYNADQTKAIYKNKSMQLESLLTKPNRRNYRNRN